MVNFISVAMLFFCEILKKRKKIFPRFLKNIKSFWCFVRSGYIGYVFWEVDF